jgi:hypothetical protein
MYGLATVIRLTTNRTIPSTEKARLLSGKIKTTKKAIRKLFSSVAQKLQDKVMPLNLCCGRHVKVIDRSSVSIPDTAGNQSAYAIAV